MDDELTAFYVRASRPLVGQLTLLTGSRHDAEELVQEAFVRLVPRWKRVRDYDDPEAWLRRVALGLATNRWRRTKVAAAHLLSLRAAEPVAQDESIDVDLMRALARLTAPRRQVVVLHHLLDLSVEQVARELDVPVGTVKSRLSRGRDDLQLLLTDREETRS